MSYSYTGDSVNIVATSVGAVMPALGAYLSLPGSLGNYASTPDSPENSVTGDIDIRVKVALDDWTPATAATLLAKDDEATNRCYHLVVPTNGTLQFLYTVDGATTSGRITQSSVATGMADGGVKWVRVTYASGTGKVNYYLSDDGVTWTPLGTERSITSGAIFNGTVAVAVGATSAGGVLMVGKTYYAEVRNGIDGTVVALFDPSGQPSSSTSVPNVAGQTAWTVNQSGGSPAVIFEEVTGHGAGALFNSKGLLVLNDAPPAGSTIRAGWAYSPNGMPCITKAAINAADLVMKAGRAFTLDGRAYVSTAAASGAVTRTMLHLPYTADGQIKVSEK